MKNLSLFLLLSLIQNITSSRLYRSQSGLYDRTTNSRTKISQRTKVHILENSSSKNKIKILVKMKNKKASISQILSKKVDIKLERINILALSINKNDLYILENEQVSLLDQDLDCFHCYRPS